MDNTLTLLVENPSLMEQLKNVLSLIKGVRVIKNDTASIGTEEAVPNDTTLAAMKEAASGNDAGIVNIDSLEGFIASMEN